MAMQALIVLCFVSIGAFAPLFVGPSGGQRLLATVDQGTNWETRFWELFDDVRKKNDDMRKKDDDMRKKDHKLRKKDHKLEELWNFEIQLAVERSREIRREEPRNLREMIEIITNVVSSGSTEDSIKKWLVGEDLSAKVFIDKCRADAFLAPKLNETFEDIEPFRNRVASMLMRLHVKLSQPGHARLTPTEAGILFDGASLKLKTSRLLQDEDVLVLFYLLKTKGYHVRIERGPDPSCGISEANRPMDATSTKPAV